MKEEKNLHERNSASCGNAIPPPEITGARERAFREALEKIGKRFRKTFTELAK